MKRVLSSLDNASYEAVWGFQDGNWLRYVPWKPAQSTLLTLEAGYGYWIDVKEATTLTFRGIPAPRTIHLDAGWNLVGYNGSQVKPVAEALKLIEDQMEVVWTYQNGRWLMYDPENTIFSDLTEMRPGMGFWIRTKAAVDWTVS